LYLLAAIQGPFFLAQWEESHTHRFRTNVGAIFGVTEGQVFLMLYLIITGWLGPEFWSTTFYEPLFGKWTRVQLLACFIFLTNAYIMSQNILAVLQQCEGVRRVNALIQLIPLVTLLVCGYFWCSTPVFRAYPCVGYLVLGAIFSHLTSQMILCALTHMKYSILQWTLVPLPFIVLNSYLPSLFPKEFSKPPLPEVPLTFVQFIFVVLCMSWFIYHVIHEITVHLGIYCLSLTKRPDFAEKAARRDRLKAEAKAERERLAANTTKKHN